MTIALAASFIATNEATTSKHRITEQKYLPPQLANLDLYSFDSSNQAEFVVSSMRMGYPNRDTSRNRDTRHQTRSHVHWREADSFREARLLEITQLVTAAVPDRDMNRELEARPEIGAGGASGVGETTRRKSVHWSFGRRNVC